MKQKYEALLILDTKGKEEDVKDMIERLETEFQREGAAVEQVQKMDKRQFTYAAGALDSGFYANFVFEAEPQVIERLRAKLKLDPDVYRQHYQKLSAKKMAQAKQAR